LNPGSLNKIVVKLSRPWGTGDFVLCTNLRKPPFQTEDPLSKGEGKKPLLPEKSTELTKTEKKVVPQIGILKGDPRGKNRCAGETISLIFHRKNLGVLFQTKIHSTKKIFKKVSLRIQKENKPVP
jgi:hypothetical protein